MTERLKKYMTPFQWAEVLAIIAFTVYFALTNTTDTWWYILIDSLAAVCGVFCVVLCAGGKKSQYYWGFCCAVFGLPKIDKTAKNTDKSSPRTRCGYFLRDC